MQKINRILFSLLVVALVLINTTPKAKADIGPKPGVHIKIKGLSDQRYYVTLLSSQDLNGPWSVNDTYEDNDNENNLASYFDKSEDMKADEIFKSFKDKDNYYYLSYRGVYEGDNEFTWSYYPPEEFKILIYIISDQGGKFLLSSPQNAYAFDSYYNLNINKEDVESTDYIVNIGDSSISRPSYFEENNINFFALLVRIVITIAIEIALARLLKISSFTAIKAILQANIVTQIILNVILLIGNYRFGYLAYLFLLIVLELFIAIGEALYYKKKFRRNDKLMVGPFAYGILANVLSFLIGFYILEKILPIVIL